MRSPAAAGLLFVLLALPVGAMDVCGDHQAALDRREAAWAEASAEYATKGTLAAYNAYSQAHNDLQDATRALHAVIDLRLSDRTSDIVSIVEPLRSIFKSLDNAQSHALMTFGQNPTPEEEEAHRALFDAKNQAERAYHLLLRLACLD